MLNEEKKEALRQRTVEVILSLRAAYLQTPGCQPLRHWQQLHDRMRMSARTCESVAEWITRMQRSLGIATPGPALSRAIVQLSDETEVIPDPEWLDLIDKEHAYIMALARLEAEDRKEKRELEKLADTTREGK